MKGYWSCVKLVDHAMMQLLIMYKTVYHAVIELLIMYEICWSSNDRLLIMDEICWSWNDAAVDRGWNLFIMLWYAIDHGDDMLIVPMIGVLIMHDVLQNYVTMKVIVITSNHTPLFASRRSASYWAKKWKWVYRYSLHCSWLYEQYHS